VTSAQGFQVILLFRACFMGDIARVDVACSLTDSWTSFRNRVIGRPPYSQARSILNTTSLLVLSVITDSDGYHSPDPSRAHSCVWTELASGACMTLVLATVQPSLR